VQGDEGLEPSLLVDGSVVLPENPVEKHSSRLADRVCEVHQPEDKTVNSISFNSLSTVTIYGTYGDR